MINEISLSISIFLNYAVELNQFLLKGKISPPIRYFYTHSYEIHHVIVTK